MRPYFYVFACGTPHIKAILTSTIRLQPNSILWGKIMIRAHEKTNISNAAAQNAMQINETTLPERWAREDLWADVAGEEIDEDVSFDLDGFDDLLADHEYND
jgi:hypothetical protein